MEWPEPWSRLAACGWTTARLGTLDDLPKRGLREVLEKAWGWEATEEELEEFHEKVKECGSTGRAGLAAWTGWRLASSGRKWWRRSWILRPLARWPCRLSRLVGRAGDNMDLRDRAERSERTRWTVMLKRIIVESELPASAGWNADPDGTAWQKGRRSTTLQKHVKTWRHVAPWLYSTYNVPWPRTIEQFIEYIMHRVAEPCGKSIPTSLMKTHVHRGGWGGAGEGKALQASRVAEHLGGGQPGAWELGSARTAASGPHPGGGHRGPGEIRDDGGGAQIFQGLHAWFRLVKLWGALRFSDTQGMPFGKLEMSGRALPGVLERTKTTGAGKKVDEVQHVFISVEAWLEEPRWLGVCYQLWKSMSEEGTSFWPCPTAKALVS